MLGTNRPGLPRRERLNLNIASRSRVLRRHLLGLDGIEKRQVPAGHDPVASVFCGSIKRSVHYGAVLRGLTISASIPLSGLEPPDAAF